MPNQKRGSGNQRLETFCSVISTCGRSYTIRIRYVWTQIFLYPHKKICGYKNLRIRVDGAHNYTEGFTGKKADWLISSVKGRNKLKRVVKAFSRFYACISSLLHYMAKTGAIDVNQRCLVIESNFC